MSFKIMAFNTDEMNLTTLVERQHLDVMFYFNRIANRCTISKTMDQKRWGNADATYWLIVERLHQLREKRNDALI